MQAKLPNFTYLWGIQTTALLKTCSLCPYLHGVYSFLKLATRRLQHYSYPYHLSLNKSCHRAWKIAKSLLALALHCLLKKTKKQQHNLEFLVSCIQNQALGMFMPWSTIFYNWRWNIFIYILTLTLKWPWI